MRLKRPKYSELTDDQRFKGNARSKIKVYQRRNSIEKQPCEICGRGNAENHHPDYSRPLVTWLCRSCHNAQHQHTHIAEEIITDLFARNLALKMSEI